MTFVDRDISGLADLEGLPGVETLAADLEAGPWPLGDRTFAAVVVTSYLWRPLFPALIRAVAPGGALLYETFAVGHPGPPHNPAYLLRPGELLEAVAGELEVRAYHHALADDPDRRITQGILAFRPG